MADSITNEMQSSLDAWNSLPEDERVTTFQQLPYAEKGDFFLGLERARPGGTRAVAVSR